MSEMQVVATEEGNNGANLGGETDDPSPKSPVPAPKATISSPQQDTKESGCRTLSLAAIIGIVVMLLANLGVAIAYGLIVNKVSDTVYEATRICDADDRGANKFEDPDPQDMTVWMYNISNPAEYLLNGGTAELHEVGVFGFDLKLNRAGMVYDKEEDTATYNLYYGLTVAEKNTCPDCDPHREILTHNPSYNALLGQVKNEGMLLLSMACTAAQIAQYSNASAPICTSAAQTSNCKCCTGDCSTYASTTSKQGGIVSWLNKYDHGFQLSSTASSFPLSTGAYTQFIKYATPFQLLRGYPSSLLGFFLTNKAKNTGDTETVAKNADLTADMKEVCYPLYCPQIEDVTFSVPNLKALSCRGQVPGKDELIEHGFTEERANELRYLEGAECDSLTPAVALGIIAHNGLATITCAKAGETAPCCPAAFVSATFGTFSGLGCLSYVNGLVVERPVYSNEEALEYLSPTPQSQHKTGCAPSDEKFEQTVWRGESEFNQWFTPATYAYPSMPWADTTIISAGLAGTAAGEMATDHVKGKLFNLREGKGVTSRFLDRQLTGGDPLTSESDVWIPFRRGSVPTHFVEHTKVRGIEANVFIPDYPEEYDETHQKQGNVPFKNVQNLVYVLSGRPVVMSLPNFYLSDEDALFQNVNTARGSTSTAGISLYRLKDGYDKDSNYLDEPEQITPETWDEFGKSDYLGGLKVEPATGASIGGNVVNMMSTFSWNCNPLYDNTCAIFKKAAPGYCHTGTIFPCSASNIFTPKVQGGKVTPVYWLNVAPDSEYATDRILGAMNLRYGISIAMLVVPIVTFTIFCIIIILECFVYPKANKDRAQHAQVPTKEEPL